MKQYLLLVLLAWSGNNFASLSDFYGAQTSGVRNYQLPKTRSTFAQQLENKIDNVIATTEKTATELNRINRTLSATAKRKLIIDTLENSYSQTVKDTQPFKKAADTILKRYDITLTAEERIQTGIYSPSNDEYADDTDLDGPNNPDTIRKMDEFTKSGKEAARSKNDEGGKNRNDWFKNENATLENVTDGLIATYNIPKKSGTEMQLKTTIESYVKTYLTEKKSLWQDNPNPENFVNRLEDAQSHIMMKLSDYTGEKLNNSQATELGKYTRNIVKETMREYVSTLLEVKYNEQLENLFKNNRFFNQPLEKPNDDSSDVSLFDAPSSRTALTAEEKGATPSDTTKTTNSDSLSTEPKSTSTIKKVTKYLGKLLNKVKKWFGMNHQSNLEEIENLLQNEDNYKNEDADFFRKLNRDIATIKNTEEQKAARELLIQAIENKIDNNNNDLDFNQKTELNHLKSVIKIQLDRSQGSQRRNASGRSSSATPDEQQLLQEEHKQHMQQDPSERDGSNSDGYGEDAY